MRGESIAYIGGRDRPVPLHVPYSEPKPRPTGLDWASTRTEPVTDVEIHDAKPQCNRCRHHVDNVSRYTGMCPACELEQDPHHNQPTGTTEEPTMSEDFTTLVAQTTELPGYAVELAQLLVATEGHPDPLVRAIRKIVTQSAMALQQAAAPHSSGSDATATAQPNNGPHESISTPGPEAPRTPPPVRRPVRPTSNPSVKTRLLDLGVGMPEVRAWCAANGVDCNTRGSISAVALDAYEAAHRPAA